MEGLSGISEKVIALVQQIVVAIPPICFVVGTLLIIKGLIRYGQANSRAHGGKGAITYIVTGACLLNSRLIMSVFVKTIEAAGMKIPGLSS